MNVAIVTPAGRRRAFCFPGYADASLSSLIDLSSATERGEALRESLNLFRLCAEHWAAGRNLAILKHGRIAYIFSHEQLRLDAFRDMHPPSGGVAVTFELSAAALSILENTAKVTSYPDCGALTFAVLRLSEMCANETKLGRTLAIVDGDTIIFKIQKLFQMA